MEFDLRGSQRLFLDKIVTNVDTIWNKFAIGESVFCSNLKTKFIDVVTCGIQAGKSPMINAAKTVFEYTCILNRITFTT